MAENKVIIDGKDREKENDYILQVNHLIKLYGASNKAEAAKLMKEGKTKDEVFKETGVTVALWDVSFKVKRGEVFVIIGLSGSGKSTVVRMLNMLNKPTSGQVMYEDSEIDTFSKKDLNEYRRDKISMVFQSFGLMLSLIHIFTSKIKFTARYSVYYYFTVRPSAASGWTDGCLLYTSRCV